MKIHVEFLISRLFLSYLFIFDLRSECSEDSRGLSFRLALFKLLQEHGRTNIFPDDFELPTLTISKSYNNRTFKEDWETVYLPSQALAIFAKHRNNPILHLVCTAPYQIGWFGMDSLNDETCEKSEGSEFTKTSGTTTIHTITLTIRCKRSYTGFIGKASCEHHIANLSKRITIFFPGEASLVNNGKTLKYKDKETWVHCPTSNPKISVKLLSVNFQKNGSLETVQDYLQYDPSVGFELRKELKGTYVCYAGGNDFVRFQDSKNLPTPIIQIQNVISAKPWQSDWDTVTFQNRALGVVAKNKNDPEIHLACSAYYKVVWIGVEYLKNKGYVYEFAEEIGLPEIKNFTVTYNSRLSIRFKIRNDVAPSIHEIKCERFNGDEFKMTYFFIPGKKVLVNSGETILYDTNDEWIRCKTSNPNIPVKLYSINSTDNKTLDRIDGHSQYNPLEGFKLKTKLKGIYICKIGDNDWVRFEPESSSPRLNSNKEINRLNSSLTPQNVLRFVLQQTDINSVCQNEDMALINQGHLYQSMNNFRRNASRTEGNQLWIQVNNNLSGRFEIPIYHEPGGIEDFHLVDVICIQQDNLISDNTIFKGRVTKKWTAYPVRTALNRGINPWKESYYTNRTDGKPFQIVTWESIPFDEHIFMVSDSQSTMHTNMISSFTCKTARNQQNLTFWMESMSGHEYQLHNDSFDSTLITTETRDFFHFKGWTLNVKLPLEAVAIKCKIAAVKQHPSLYYSGERRFKTKNLQVPGISTVVSPTIYQFHDGDTYKHIACHANGEPEPKYVWEKDGQSIENVTGFKQRIEESGESILDFPEIRKSHGGSYRCKAFNKLGSDRLEFTVVVEENPRVAQERRMKLVTIVGVVIVVLCALVICGFGIYRYYSAKALLRGLTEDEIKEFFEGRPELAKHVESQPFAGDFDVLPYNTSFEIDFSDAVLDYNSVLGSGEFAIVVKGSIKSKGMEVAVKIAKGTADVNLFKSLLSEVKILSYIGSHSNVAGLVGVNTADIQKKNIYIYMDLCELGSLEKYLRASKITFVDLIDEQGQINISNMDSSNKCISTIDLLRWSAEIAAGMEYLSYKSIVHADLAARNVLLTREKTVRVSDFGLSKKLYECNLYVKKTKCPLPWRWMALESLQTLTFSSESDVWSFGVTIWEIFTLGDVPFPNEEWNKAFVDMLICGIRMGKPKFGTTDIYSKIGECWDEKPAKRPQFTSLRIYFHQLVESLKA